MRPFTYHALAAGPNGNRYDVVPVTRTLIALTEAVGGVTVAA